MPSDKYLYCPNNNNLKIQGSRSQAMKYEVYRCHDELRDQT